MTILSSQTIDFRPRAAARAATDGAEGVAIFCTIGLVLLLLAATFNASALMPAIAF